MSFGPRERSSGVSVARNTAARVHSNRDIDILLDALQNKKVEQCISLLEDDNIVVQRTGPNGITTLMAAARLGNIEILNVIIDKAPDLLHDNDEDGCAALFYALNTDADNSVQIAKLLVKEGCDALHEDDNGTTPLDIALEEDMEETARMMIQTHPTCLCVFVNRCGEDDTIDRGGVRRVKQLIELGASKSSSDANQWMPMHFAARNGCVAVAELLIDPEVGTEIVTGEGRTQLHLAAESGRIDMVNYLIETGANVGARTASGFTAVFLVCFAGHNATATTILRKMSVGAELQVDNTSGLSLMRAAARGGCSGVVETIRGRIQEASLQQILEERLQGCTVAFDAIEKKQSLVAELLLDMGAAVEGRDASGNTALHLAAEHGMVTVVEELLDRGLVDVEAKNRDGETPIHRACANRQEQVVTLMLQRQPPPVDDQVSTEGWSALHWAVFRRRLDVIRLLVTKGANVGKEAADGTTPVSLVHGKTPESIEMREWLSIPVDDVPDTAPSDLARPSQDEVAAEACNETRLCMVDFYKKQMIKKTGFTVGNVLYQYGPGAIMSGISRAANVDGSLLGRWIHLPLNNVRWLEDLSHTVYFDYSINPGHRSEASRAMSNRLCKFIEQCFVDNARTLPQMHKAFFKDLHEHEVVVRNEGFDPPNLGGRRIALSMPLLSFTALKHQEEMRRARGPVDGERPMLNTDDSEARRRNWLKQAVQLYTNADSPNAYIQGPLTLDEYFHGELLNISNRSTSQVLYRRQRTEPDGKSRFICLVDHLWALTIDDETVVTCPPQHWDENSIDLGDIISERYRTIEPAALTLFDMVGLIILASINASMSLPIGSTNETILQAFAGEISKVTIEEAYLFSDFKSHLDNRDSSSRHEKTRDISREMRLLEDIKEIQDELTIIQRVLQRQSSVVNDVFEYVSKVGKYGNDRRWVYRSRSRDSITWSDQSYQSYQSYQSDDESHKVAEILHACSKAVALWAKETDRLLENTEQVHKNLLLSHAKVILLLDLRQKDANLQEALSARLASDDAAKQAEATAKQGRTILVFTVVTIVFLPLSFLTLLFALDVTLFPHNDKGAVSYEPRWLFARHVGVTVALAVPLIIVAFFANHARDLFSGSKDAGPESPATRQDPVQGQGQGQGQAKVEVGEPNSTDSNSASASAAAPINQNPPAPRNSNQTKEGVFDRFFDIAQLKGRKKKKDKTHVNSGGGMV